MLSTHPDPLPPHFYTLYKYIPMYLFTQRREGGGGIGESVKVRGSLVHKRGRKYQHD
jgi:hypothetical protein